MINFRKAIIVVIALVCCGVSYGQSLTFLTIPQDSRTLSMGGASVAMDANAYAVNNNPAAMSLSGDKGAIGANYLIWQPDVADNNLISGATYLKLGDKLGLGISGNSFSYKAYDIYNSYGSTTSTFKPSELALNLGLSYRVISNLSVGANIKYISSSLASDDFVSDYKNANSVAFDLSAMYKLGNLNVAVMATNIGSKISYGTTSAFGSYDLPSTVKAGAAYNLGINDNSSLVGTLEAGYLLYSSGAFVGLGAEYSYRNMLFVRGGYHYGDDTITIPSYASLGVGAKLFGVSLDIAYLLAGSDSPLKNTLSFGLGWCF